MEWRDAEWLEEAHLWIREHASDTLTGPIEQPHVYPWSTVMRVPTADGDLWFKANSPVHRFEAGLVTELAMAAPDVTVVLIAVNIDRGWLLMRDAGEPLSEAVRSIDEVVERWKEILPRYADLQIALAPRVNRLLALGLPDERLAGFTDRFERLLDDPSSLLLERPDGISTDEHHRLRSSVPQVAALCVELAAVGIPETLSHDEFHDGQILVRDGRYVFLDWADSSLTHPFHTLAVTMRVLAWRHSLAPDAPELYRLRDVYLERFEGFASPSDLRVASEIALRTGTIQRALVGHRYYLGEPWVERDDSIPYDLKLFLANGPIGSWEP